MPGSHKTDISCPSLLLQQAKCLSTNICKASYQVFLGWLGQHHYDIKKEMRSLLSLVMA